MRVTRKYFFIGAGLLLVGIGAYLGARTKQEATSQQPRSPVQVIKSGLAEQKSIPVTVNANGYVTAVDTVDVRPQVQNVVRTVHVQEGQEVRAGQVLFTLDERSDMSSLDKAKAQLARDRTDLADAEITLKRNQELQEKNFVSPSVVDSARNKVDSLRSTMRADEAAVQSSTITLGYNRINASISGRIGAISVHPGSLVQPSGTPMLTISRLDPIAVSFSVPERERAYIAATYPKADAPVFAQLPGNKELEGKLVFIDNTADPQSGTIKMKAQFANGNRMLWPGSYVNVRLISRTLPDAVVIPAQAIVTGPVDKFVYTVQPDDTVKIQKIEVATIVDEKAAITGLAAGARIVIEGAQNLRPGGKVKEMQAASASAKREKKSPPQ